MVEIEQAVALVPPLPPDFFDQAQSVAGVIIAECFVGAVYIEIPLSPGVSVEQIHNRVGSIFAPVVIIRAGHVTNPPNRRAERLKIKHTIVGGRSSAVDSDSGVSGAIQVD